MQFSAKTLEEAIALGLTELNLQKEQAEIIVIEEPTKGLFGKLKGKAVVDIAKKEEIEIETEKKSEKPVKKEETKEEVKVDLKKASDFIKNTLKLLKIEAQIEVKEDGENPSLNLISNESSSLIGYRGEVLDALQTLAGAVANIGNKNYKKVSVDCENYRFKREETLIKLAHRLEQKATEMKREVILEAMNPFERRIIHTALAESTTVTTKSEGVEPNRYVVIVPNEKDEFAKPYNAGRNNGDKGRNHRNHGGKNFKKGARHGGSGFIEEKKKSSSMFGTYLGNSLKDKE